MFPAVLVLLLPPQTATHSLILVVTYIVGETQFPEFSLVLKVNDIPVNYYDNDVKQLVTRRFWRPDDLAVEKDQPMLVIEESYYNMKLRFQMLSKSKNTTAGVHVLQGTAACDLNDDSLSRFSVSTAYDGEEITHYDAIQEQYSLILPEVMWNKMKFEAVQRVYRNVYQPLCVRTLQRYLQQDKNFLLRKVHPRVRVFQKTQADSGETQVICLATGFYPRHINLSLLRDERPVPEEHLTGGELLPNGDGTYQMRKSLRVSEEELQGKHRYTCTVTHLSPNNTLHVSWEQEGPDTVIISVAVISVLTVTALIITATVLCRRRQTGKNVQYAAAQSG